MSRELVIIPESLLYRFDADSDTNKIIDLQKYYSCVQAFVLRWYRAPGILVIKINEF